LWTVKRPVKLPRRFFTPVISRPDTSARVV